MGAQLSARCPGGSERLVQCQIVPWIDWKALWPDSCSSLLGGSRNSFHELEEIALVQRSRRTNARAKIDSERANRANSLTYVFGAQPTRVDDPPKQQ